MGRQSQSRQARRAQERRQREHGTKGEPSLGSGGRRGAGHRPTTHGRSRSGPNWSLIAGGGVVAIAIVVFILAVAGVFNIKGSGAAAGATATIGPGPSIAGIGCDQGMTNPTAPHIHAHIAIYVKGKLQPISSNFGHDYNHDCLFWMHAHQDVNGIIHLESPVAVHPPLSTWYKILKETLPQSGAKVPQVAPTAGEQEKVWVNLKPYHGDPMNIKLYRHTNITIEIGAPFTPPKPFTFPQGL